MLVLTALIQVFNMASMQTNPAVLRSPEVYRALKPKRTSLPPDFEESLYTQLAAVASVAVIRESALPSNGAIFS